MKLNHIIPFFLILFFAACTNQPKAPEVQSPLPSPDSTKSMTTAEVKRDCGLIQTAKEIGVPMEDTFGIYGNEINKAQFLALGLDSVSMYKEGLKYAVLGKIRSEKYTLLLYSSTSSGECEHWLVSYDVAQCKIIDKMRTVYGDVVEYHTETRTRIMKGELRITTRISDVNGKRPKKEIRTVRITEDGKFVRGM